MDTIDRTYLRYVRYAVQWGIFLFLLYAGYRFYFFVDHFLAPGTVLQGGKEAILKSRAPSVEGFLPIGALMALKLWVTEGIIDSIHPAALIIFVAALVMALVLKKGFCGWICPVGTISDSVWKLGKKIFGKNFTVPRYADYGLRSVKYILMAFFIYVVVLKMPAFAILQFLEEDYYKIADVKMLFFFTKMTTATAISLSLLFVLSLFSKNFWCRYLCPYGALLGLVSFLSPLKITRNDRACIHCGKCTKNCPSLLPVEQLESVRSPECTGCLTCVSYCPAKGALDVSLLKRKTVNPVLFVCLIIAVFFGSIGIAKLTGNWHSAVTYEEYQRIIPRTEHLDHP
jgi:polyferredoxin